MVTINKIVRFLKASYLDIVGATIGIGIGSIAIMILLPDFFILGIPIVAFFLIILMYWVFFCVSEDEERN